MHFKPGDLVQMNSRVSRRLRLEPRWTVVPDWHRAAFANKSPGGSFTALRNVFTSGIIKITQIMLVICTHSDEDDEDRLAWAVGNKANEKCAEWVYVLCSDTGAIGWLASEDLELACAMKESEHAVIIDLPPGTLCALRDYIPACYPFLPNVELKGNRAKLESNRSRTKLGIGSIFLIISRVQSRLEGDPPVYLCIASSPDHPRESIMCCVFDTWLKKVD